MLQMLPKLGTISIHAPRTGSDMRRCAGKPDFSNFNPRSPHGERRAPVAPKAEADISIHAPRTGSDGEQYATTSYVNISIHAPRTGSDKGANVNPAAIIRISIHAPRTGSDPAEGTNEAAEWHFNPRSPHGERRVTAYARQELEDFNPRSPHGERLRQGIF